jgi:hypothetical protein
MAIHFLKDTGLAEKLGSGIGHGVETGINNYLQELSKIKLGNILNEQKLSYKKKENEAFQDLLRGANVPQEWISLLGAVGPQHAGRFLHEAINRGWQPGAQPSSIIPSSSYTEDQHSQYQTSDQVYGLYNNMTPLQQMLFGNLGMSGNQPAGAQQGMQKGQGLNLNDLLNYQDTYQPTNDLTAALRRPKPLSPETQARLKQAQEELDFRKSEANKKYNLQKSAHNLKRYQPYITDLSMKGTRAARALQILDRLDELNNSGNLNQGIFGKVPFKTKESEEFENLARELLDLDTGSGKISATKLKELQSRNPQLAQHPEARSSHINYLKSKYRNEFLRAKALDSVLAEHDGMIPDNLEQMAKKRFAKLYKDINATKQTSAKNEPEEEEQAVPAQQFNNNTPSGPSSESSVPDHSIFSDELRKGHEYTNPMAALRLLGRAVKGGAEGITGLTTLLPNLANFISGGRVSIPGVQQLQELPGNIINSIIDTEPKSETEKFAGNIIEDVGSFLSPSGVLGLAGGGWLNKAAKFLNISPKAALKVASAGNVAQWLTEKVGGSKGAQSAAKMGTMLATSLIGPQFIQNDINKLTNTISHTLPNAQVKAAPSLINDAVNLYRSLDKIPSLKYLRDTLDNFGSNMIKIKDIAEIATKDKKLFKAITSSGSANSFNLRDLWKVREVLTSAVKDPKVAALLQEEAPELIKYLDHALVSGTSKAAPEVNQMLTDFTQLNNAASATNKVSNFVRDNLTIKPKNPIIAGLLGGFGYVLPGRINKIGAGIAALGAGEIEKVVRLMLTNKAFRKFYGDAVNAAILGSSKAMNSAISKLDKINIQ